MSAYRLPRFSKPSTIRSIQPQHLIEFLSPHAEFFEEHGVALPSPAPDAELDYEGFVHVFMTPDESTPRPLIDALYLVDEMSTEEGMHALLEDIEEQGLTLPFGADPTPAEVAVLVWLADSDILERRHARQNLWRASTFEYFQSDNPEITFVHPSPSSLRTLERNLDDWYETKRRGRGSRVFVFPDEREVWFLVRHGLPFAREESLQGEDVASVCFRPLTYDVVVFDRRLSELKINANLSGEKKLYCEKFGEHIFGGSTCFPGSRKYTLEPLQVDGEDSLACGDIAGIESITLTEYHIAWGGAYHEVEVRKADDIFAALLTRSRMIPGRARIICAAFKVKFEDSPKPRVVRIKPSNIARYSRDSDARLVEEWLERRGFILMEAEEEHEPVAEILAGD